VLHPIFFSLLNFGELGVICLEAWYRWEDLIFILQSEEGLFR